MKKIFLLSLLTFFCLGQLGRFDIPGTNITLHLNDLFIFTSVSGWLILRRQKAGQFIGKQTLFKPILFVSLAMTLSLVVNAFHYPLLELVTSALYLFRWIAYAGFFFLLKMEFAPDKTLLRRGLVLAGLIISLTGIIQYLLLPDTTFLAASEWDDHYFRLIGVFLDPGFTGAILAILLAVAYLARKKITVFFPILVLYTALALTYSRASYLMYVVIFTSLSYFKKSLTIFVIAVVVLTATLFMLPKHPGEGTKISRDNSVFARFNNWQQSLGIWTTAPVFGVGFNTYRYVQRDRGFLSVKDSQESHAGAGADASILLVLATTGIVGFTAFLFLLRSIWRQSREDLPLKIILPAILIGSFFNNLLFYAWIMELIWILLASIEKPTEKT